jgi:HPt (histidine-containing phosphotransfer) domain-containing protein
MTLQGCYEAMGGDFADVMGRLRTEERILRFLRKVPEDPSYDLLCASLDQRNMEEAFRAAHTMKGICQNLSLTKLYQSSSALTELLRGRPDYNDQIVQAMEQVKTDYAEMAACVQQLG